MTERDLLDYRGTKTFVDCLTENLREATTKKYGVTSINFEKVASGNGKHSEYIDYLPEKIEQTDIIGKQLQEARQDLIKAEENYYKALSVLELTEKVFCHKRYVEGKVMTVIASEMRYSRSQLYEIRNKILEKIKDI